MLQIFWNLLPLNPDGSKKENASHNSKDYKDAFDKSLIKRFREGIFTKEEIIRISQHASLFFKHFLLYDFVFNNAKPSDIKKITIPKKVPKIAPSLNEALTLVKDSPEQEEVNLAEMEENKDNDV